MIEYVGRDAIVETPDVAFTYQVSETPRDFYKFKGNSNNLDWNNKFDYIGNYLVYPYGSANDLPDVIKDVVQNNYIAPGIIKKKTQLLWGSGPKLYTEKFDNGILKRVWLDDEEVKSWLDSWGHEEYLLKACTDYHHVEGFFTRYELQKGALVGKNFIARLVHCQPDKSRLATSKDSNDRKPTHVVITDWSFARVDAIQNYKVFPIFNFLKPFENLNAVYYSNMYSFCTDYYTVPDLYGSLEWLNRSTSVPLIFKALSKNSINLKYHIISPQEFWNNKEEEMKNNCTQRGIVYKYEMLRQYQKEFLEKIAVVLSGDENTGKYLHTTKTFTVEGTNLIEHGWEIKVIDQNIKDFVKAQIEISQRADHALSAGIGLHSALGNVSESGKSDSGSEQLYALKNYLLTGIDIPEMIVMKPLNYALKANFPEKNLKIGFYHEMPEKEQDITPSKRIKNNV